MTSRPILKSAGGKRQLLPKLQAHVPLRLGAYYEPMMGGAALFFHLRSAGRLDGSKVVLGDANPYICDAMTAARDDVDGLIARLQSHARVHGKDHYLQVRQDLGSGASDQRGADFLYLNKTCFNGLTRFSKAGRFNTPMGRYVDPPICDEPTLRAASAALAGVAIVSGDFEVTCKDAARGDFVYFDPPYLPISATSDFTMYAKAGFTLDDHRRLCELATHLKGQGATVLLSNSAADPIRQMYAASFTVEEVAARRSINSKVAGRGNVTDLLIV